MRVEVFCFWGCFLRLRVIARLVGHLGRRNRGERDAGWVVRARLRHDCGQKWIREQGAVLAGVQSQRGIAEQVLKGPAAGKVNVNAASGVADAGADFEQLDTQSFDLCRTPRLRQLLPEEVDQVVGGGMQQQSEGVGQETVATQTVGAKTILELLDAVLAFPT